MKYNLYYKHNDNSKQLLAYIETNDDRINFEGQLSEFTSWEYQDGCIHKENKDSQLFFAKFIVKWDLCSHWYFLGEDFKDTNQNDSYYHICGKASYEDFMLHMWFVIKCAKDFFENDAELNYYEKEEFDELLLNYEKVISVNDYVIKKYKEKNL